MGCDATGRNGTGRNGVKWKSPQVTLLTSGLMQIGWADHTFVPGGPESGDGVGDIRGSWAYDGARRQKWNEHQSDYGEAWKVQAVVKGGGG